MPNVGTLDVEADRAIVWTRNKDEGRPASPPTPAGGAQGQSSELDFYMAGHVVLRTQRTGSRESTVLQADELYYDTNRNVMIAVNSRLEVRTTRFAAKLPQFNEPVIFTSAELFRTGPTTYEFTRGEVFSSKLQSDPGLKIRIQDATIEDRVRPQTNLFGRPVLDPKTGKQAEIPETILVGRNVTTELEGVPIFYTPYLVDDIRNPMGPLESLDFGYSNIFGAQFGVGLNIHKLLGLQQPAGVHWRLNLDYLSRRGPALGTDLDFAGNLNPPGQGGTDPLGLADLFGYQPPNPLDPDAPITAYVGMVRAYGIYDAGTDILGGNRPNSDFRPTSARGRLFTRDAVWDLPGGFSIQAQFSAESDRNFLEQYYKPEFDQDPNHTTYIYVKQQQDNYALSALAQVRTENWFTQTEWLPRLDGYLIGQSFFDRFTSNSQVSLAYAHLRTSSDAPQPILNADGTASGTYLPGTPGVSPTDVSDGTLRGVYMQELAYPLALGPFKVVPYVKGVLEGYNNDLDGTSLTRVWGGGGARASIPFTRLFPEVQSDLFNLQGINHKIVVSSNYFYADASDPYTKLPQLDRLNDDASDEMLRDFKPQEPIYNSTYGTALATSKLYDPQLFAIRQLIDDRFDTLDHIDVLQFDLRQRLQTKRGYPGSEHIVDWMVLDLSFSWFPEPTRDNFGKPFSFVQYAYLWNIGDRTSIESTGWFDPQPGAPSIFTVGAYFNRPDRTNFYIGYRAIEPLQSRAVTASATYIFSPKYAMTFSTTYDFGTSEALTNSLVFTRTGSDLQVSLGVTYNALQNNLGAVFQIVPTLAPINSQNLTGLAQR